MLPSHFASEITGLDGETSRLRRTQAREELRLQTGTLRFDISTLASQLDKSKRKEALKLGDAFYSKVRIHAGAGSRFLAVLLVVSCSRERRP